AAYAVRAEQIEAEADCGEGIPRPCSPSGLDTLRRARRHATTAHVSFGVAGAALLTATALEVIPRARRKSKRKALAGFSVGIEPSTVHVELHGPLRLTSKGSR